MFCVSATGDLLPPYVVYRAANMWDSWREGGPKGAPCCEKKCCLRGARYNRSNHGWFDAVCFTDWFKTTFLSHAKLLEGKKVLIGDNLSSHFTPDVLKLCKENQIDFVCLPPNSTHLCQPLDVSFFGPVKRYWKQILLDWKKSNLNVSSVEKSVFPRLLKRLFDNLSETAKTNAISGFAACGIYPLSKDKLLSKIPTDREDAQSNVKDILVDYLQSQRNPNKRDLPMKRKRLNIVPGRSVAADDSPEKGEQAQAGPSAIGKKTIKHNTPYYSKDVMEKESDESEEGESENNEEIESEYESSELESIQESQNMETELEVKKGSWVLVPYCKKKIVKHFIGNVVRIMENTQEAEVKFLKHLKDQKFVWPNTEDHDNVPLSEIIKPIGSPGHGRRGELLFYEDLSDYNLM